MNVYDFDKTIFAGDSTLAFYRWCLRRYPKMSSELCGTLAAYGRYYILKKGTKTQCKQRMYRFLRHIPDVPACVERFWDERASGVRSWYLAQKREDDLIISASPEFLILPICRRLGVRAIASRVDAKTGVYDGENCHGEEKVRRFREAYPDGTVEEFYSDALSDAPMARLAERAYLVKGDILSPWEVK